MFRKCQKNSPKTDNVLLEFRLNQFITLKLIDFGDGIGSTQVYVNGRNFNVSIFSLKESYELLHSTKTYCCMDEVHRNLIGNNNLKFSKVDSDTMFWIYCHYIRAWIDHDYDTRLLQMDEAFPILNALYKVGDIKARKVLKIEVVKRFLRGYIPVITYLISMGYLRFFEFEEIMWLFDKCLKIAGFHHFSTLKTQIFWFLRDTGFSYFFSNKLEESIKYLNNALKLCLTDIQTLKQLGIVYLKNGDYEIARAYLEYISNIPNTNNIFIKNYIVEAWENLGELYNGLFLFNNAIIACKMAMDIYPNHVNTWDQISIAYEGLGDFKRSEDAKKKFKKNEKKMKKIMRKEGAQW